MDWLDLNGRSASRSSKAAGERKAGWLGAQLVAQDLTGVDRRDAVLRWATRPLTKHYLTECEKRDDAALVSAGRAGELRGRKKPQTASCAGGS
jgi:hypothetical protein